jgi:hypothetical protein
MNKIKLNSLVVLTAFAATAVVYSADSKPPEKSFNDYKVVWEQNMFVKDRRKPYTSTTRGSRGGSDNIRTTRAPETLFALRGVVFEEGTFHAYLEDMTAGKLLRLTVGESIAKGKIADIEIDAVAYESNGQTTWVTVGSDLRGQSAVLPSSDSYGSSQPPRVTPTPTKTPGTASATDDEGNEEPGTAVTPPATTTADPSTMSLEEKMRQRRLQGK